jgi:hypothetical protein
MAQLHKACKSCPNSPNYYWEQALHAFDTHGECNEHETYMYLILFYISILGE